MDNQVRTEIIRRLVQDFGFREREKYLQQGECPVCNKREMYISLELPYLVKCGRENKCGHEITVRSLYPDLFENWSKRYVQTEANPHAAADAYLRDARGLDIAPFKGCYTQGAFARNGMGSATVRFTLANGKGWERLIDEPERFEQKANFIGSYAGYWWEPPGIDLRTTDKIFITEGIFNAMSLVQAGFIAVATLSSNNYPSMLLSMLEDAISEQGKRPRLIWAFDDDRAGREHIIKYVRRAEAAGWECGAALPSKYGSSLDWNDLLMRERLKPEDMKQYRYHGRLLLAKSASDKSVIIYEHEKKNTFYFSFAEHTYWFSIDSAKLETATTRIMDFGGVFDEDVARRRAVEESGALSEIANCVLQPLYFQRSLPTDESWYYIQVRTRRTPPVRGAFTSAQLASASEFKKRLLHLVKGAIYTGNTKQLDAMIRQLEGIKEVETQNFIGYNRQFGAWIFNNVAVSDGVVYKTNQEDYFEMKKLSAKSLSLSPSLSINPDLSQFDISWVDDIWTAFGVKGYVVLAFWYGSLFAEQIRKVHKSFPFLEFVGEPESGKSTLIEFMWKLCGRDDYEGFDPSKSTASARSRNFSQVSNLPVVLIEGDRDERTAKLAAFDYDELKSLYNGKAPRAIGIKTSGNETHEPPFMGSIVIAQNADVDGSPALLSRIIHLYTRKPQRPEITLPAAERLEHATTESVSGFIVSATSKEREFMQVFSRQYESARADMLTRGVKYGRPVKTHAQLIAALEALPLVIPVDDLRISETREFIIRLASERQQALSMDHVHVREFWELFDYLDGMEPFGANHAPDDKPDEISVNFNHLQELISYYRQSPSFTMKEIKKLLKTGRSRPLLRSGSVRSSISEKYNSGKARESRKPEHYHCWTFKRKAGS
ncbi:TPA: toprim domain-containing protein [Enterobacter kobei]|nr:toprim domain-containing protein [Enterobacter kobei]